MLKKPLHTSIAVERDEFNDFDVSEEGLHIVISVRDFRAIIQHAGLHNSEITALYSIPSRPMQIKYDGADTNMKCEFLLMTVGERGATTSKTKKARTQAKDARQPQLEAATSRAASHAPNPVSQPLAGAPIGVHSDTVPPLRPPITMPSRRPPPPSYQEESLFVPQDNDDQWDPVTLGDDDQEEDAQLGWDASDNPVCALLVSTASS